jgi:AcrR family transcriptional regulator
VKRFTIDTTTIFGRPTKIDQPMQDRRAQIISAGLQLLAEEGLAGFSQPRVAARAGLRQSHLTYYFPTRVDLLAAVARAAIDGQLATVDGTPVPKSSDQVPASIARTIVRHDNTRVLMSLAQAADHEPILRELFRELTVGLVERSGRLLDAMDVESSQVNRDLLHALTVGLAAIDLATARPDGKRRSTAVLNAVFGALRKAK